MPQTDESPPDLTILILCRNEEGGIARCVEEASRFLRRNEISGEVVVVDNASSDRSRERALEAGARVAHEPRIGYGAAIMGGIAAAKGEFIILGDGDGEYDLDALEPFWEKLQDGADFVIGNRMAGSIRSDSSALRRYVGNPLLSGLGKLLFQSPVNDFHSGLRGFRADSARALDLQSPGMEMASEMVVKARLRGMRFAEAPVFQRPAFDPARSSHLRVWRDGWRHLRLLLALSPRWLFLYPGVLALALGALALAVPLAYPVEAGGVFGVYTMLFGSAFMVSGAQLTGFALLARVVSEGVGLSAGNLRGRLRDGNFLEFSLLAGLVLALAGAAGGVWSLFVLAETGAVDVQARLRVAIPSVTALVLGVQIMFSGFLFALLSALHGESRKL